MEIYVALFGEWNTTNIGDRAIGSGAARYLLSLGFSVKLFSLGGFSYLGEIKNKHEVDVFFSTIPAASLSNKKSIKSVISRVGHRLLPQTKFIARFIRNYSRQGNILVELSKCKGVVVGGGALLEDNGLHFPSSIFLLNKICKQSGLPVFCLGCSTSSKLSVVAKMIFRNFFNYAHLVAARDEESRRSLQPLSLKKLYVFGDFALGADFQLKSFTRRQRVGINIMHFAGSEKSLLQEYRKLLAGLIGYLSANPQVEISLFTTGDTNDLTELQYMRDEFALKVPVSHPRNLNEIVSYIQAQDVVFSTRLHAAILAIHEHVPAIALCITPKINNFFNTIGLGNFCLTTADNTDLGVRVGKLLRETLTVYPAKIDFSLFNEGKSVASRSLQDLWKVNA